MMSHNGLNKQAGGENDLGAHLPASPLPHSPLAAAFQERKAKGALTDKSNEAGVFKIKSYYARTVEEALIRAREEMGAEAVLVHSRKTPLESRHLGPYEVVFSYPGKPPHPAPAEHSRPGLTQRGDTRDPVRERGLSEMTGVSLSAEMTQMRHQMEEIRKALALRTIPAVEPENTIAIEDVAQDRLFEAGFDAETAAEVIVGAAEELRQLRCGPDDSAFEAAAEVPRARLCAVLQHELARRMRGESVSREREATANVVAFLGPPGAGKTTSLIKLALLTNQASSKPIHLISADCYRIGAAEQMKTFASILGASIDFVDSPRSMAQAIEANSYKESILIDLPGLSGSDFELLDELAAYLGMRGDISKHLVLPATMRLKDMKRCLTQYERFNASSLVFTHLDETDSFGHLYCASQWSAKPISYLSAGQQIPEDFEDATESRVLELILGPDWNEAAA